ncbi:MAG: lytic transglycosylase domain-containing protein [Treponema sp.]|nr:lytic transglycosylase domain-containing protein [Treponema sp.]
MDISNMDQLFKLDPSAPFYAGLLVESAGDKLRSRRLFEAALGSPIPKVKSEACRKLIPALAESKDIEQAKRILALIAKNKTPAGELTALKGAALYVLDRNKEILTLYNSPFSSDTASDKAAEEFRMWNKAFLLLAAVKQEKPGLITVKELRPFLLDSEVTGAYRWAYEELLALQEYTLPNAEKIAAAGRLAVYSRKYSEALLHFDRVQSSQLTLFFRHTSLLGDLGRSYVVSSQEKGFKLFTDWESAIRTGKNSPVNQGISRQSDTIQFSAAELNTIRYTLLFYAGRIRRQQNKHGEARELFTRAVPLAPNNIQKDSCIWYVLNSAFTEKPETVPALIRNYAGIWHNDNDFYDILDKLSVYLTGQNKWGDIADVFSSIRHGKDGSIIARYAYLTGRAVSLGYISGRNLNARDYYTIAYEESNASFYYRTLAASYLGKTVVPVKSQSTKKEVFPHGDELEFFYKFFEYGASSYAMAYVRENAPRYTKGEMRVLAGTFASSERYLESIQITGIFMRREGYEMERADLELYYPNPFSELIERNARNNGIHPSLFFGLIRTESAFTPAIASHAGAVGLTQIMPATGKAVAAMIKNRGGPDYAADGDVDLTNPEINAHMGAFYLKDLINSMGSPMLALLGYNYGPGRVNRLRRSVPSLPEDIFIETITVAETRNYGKQVTAAAAAYGYLYYGMSMHDVVKSIFK